MPIQFNFILDASYTIEVFKAVSESFISDKSSVQLSLKDGRFFITSERNIESLVNNEFLLSHDLPIKECDEEVLHPHIWEVCDNNNVDNNNLSFLIEMMFKGKLI